MDLTPRMQRVMEAAASIARDYGVGKVGTEHVLFAILDDERAIATQVIAQTADISAVFENLRQILGSSQYTATGPGYP